MVGIICEARLAYRNYHHILMPCVIFCDMVTILWGADFSPLSNLQTEGPLHVSCPRLLFHL